MRTTPARCRQDRADRARSPSLAALLDETAHKLLGIGLQDAVDLIEHAVDIGVEAFLAGAHLARVGVGALVVPAAAPRGTHLLLTGHDCLRLLERISAWGLLPDPMSRRVARGGKGGDQGGH